MEASLGLLAGIVASDGHLERDGRGIKVISTSKPFVDEVVLPLMRELSGKEPSVYVSKTGFSKRRKYVAYLYDGQISQKLSKEYAVPRGKKATTMRAPTKLGPAQELDYLQGWFAGEGSVSQDTRKTKYGVYVTPEIELWVKNKWIAEWILEALEKRGVQPRMHYSARNGQHLIIVRRLKSVSYSSKGLASRILKRMRN